MSLGVKNTKQLTAPWTSWFLYGCTGSAKTTSASTFPKPLFLVPENERSHVALMGLDFPYIEITGANAPYSPSTGKGGMKAVLQAIHAEYNKNPNSFPYDTIVVEALSHYVDLALADFGAGSGDNRQVYGKLGDHLREMHNRLRSIEVHVVYTALSTTTGGDEGTAQLGGPLMPGKMQFKLPAACDVLGYCEPGTGKEPKYRMHFERFKCFEARTRFKRMPRTLENFDFTKIARYLTVASSDK